MNIKNRIGRLAAVLDQLLNGTHLDSVPNHDDNGLCAIASRCTCGQRPAILHHVAVVEKELATIEFPFAEIANRQPVAYRYKEKRHPWENEKKWELASVELGEVYLQRKAIAEQEANHTACDSHYLGMTIEPLYAVLP